MLLARWGPALLVMAVIFFASGTPGEKLPNAGLLDLPFKKGGHFLGYALLGAAYLRGIAWRQPPRLPDAVWAVALAVLYASTDELHQVFTPGRTPALADVLIDTLGAVVGSGLSWRRRHRPDARRPRDNAQG